MVDSALGLNFSVPSSTPSGGTTCHPHLIQNCYSMHAQKILFINITKMKGLRLHFL